MLDLLDEAVSPRPAVGSDGTDKTRMQVPAGGSPGSGQKRQLEHEHDGNDLGQQEAQAGGAAAAAPTGGGGAHKRGTRAGKRVARGAPGGREADEAKGMDIDKEPEAGGVDALVRMLMETESSLTEEEARAT